MGRDHAKPIQLFQISQNLIHRLVKNFSSLTERHMVILQDSDPGNICNLIKNRFFMSPCMNWRITPPSVNLHIYRIAFSKRVFNFRIFVLELLQLSSPKMSIFRSSTFTPYDYVYENSMHSTQGKHFSASIYVTIM